MTGKGLVWIAFAVSAAAELLIPAAEPSLLWWHRVPGFQAVYGLLGCVLIVIVSKALGKFWLQRPEGGDD